MMDRSVVSSHEAKVNPNRASSTTTEANNGNAHPTSATGVLSDMLHRNGLVNGQVQNGIGMDTHSAPGAGNSGSGRNLFNMNWSNSLANGTGFSSSAGMQKSEHAGLNGGTQTGFAQGQAGIYAPLLMDNNNSSSVGNMQSLPMLFGTLNPGVNLNGMSSAFPSPADLTSRLNSSASADAAFATALQMQVQHLAQCAPKPSPQLKLVTSRSSAARVLRSKDGAKPRGRTADFPLEGNNREAWSPEEDARLIEIVNHVGPKRWSHISRLLGTGRSSKQCRERWSNQINPALNRSKWTEKEDAIILRLHNKHGNRWALIADSLPGRTDNMIKNRFNGSLKMKQAKQDKPPENGKGGRKAAASSSCSLSSFTKSVLSVKSEPSNGGFSEPIEPVRQKSRPAVPHLKISTPHHRDVDFAREVKQTPPAGARQGVSKAGFSVSPQEQKTIVGKSMPSASGTWKAVAYTLGRRNTSKHIEGVVYWNPGKNIATLKEPHGRGPWEGVVQVPRRKVLKVTTKLLEKLQHAIGTTTNAPSNASERNRPAVLGKRRAQAPGKKSQPRKARRKVLASSRTVLNDNNHYKASKGTSSPANVSWPVSSSKCKCRKSQCLKLYCDCFSSQSHCGPLCKCTDCKNKEATPAWKEAYRQCKKKKANKHWREQSPATTCKCRSTRCLKKYCDCFRTGRACTVKCACSSCLNNE